MRKFFFLFPLCVILLLTGSVDTFALELLDASPALRIAKWLQGAPVDVTAQDDRLYVIEFWATWCPPCRRSIPELNALHDKYSSQNVVIIGITQEEEETVQNFLKEQEMKYTVALDQDSYCWKNYAESSGVNGIPHAFLVRNGKLWWEGSPFDNLEKVIRDMVAGSYSAEEAQKNREEARISEEIAQLLELWMQEYLVYANFGRDRASADALGVRILEKGTAFPEMMGILAWHIAENDSLRYRNLEFADILSEKACSLTEYKDPDILDSRAKVLFAQGKRKAAIELQKKAIDLADNEEVKEMLLEGLQEMQETD